MQYTYMKLNKRYKFLLPAASSIVVDVCPTIPPLETWES